MGTISSPPDFTEKRATGTGKGTQNIIQGGPTELEPKYSLCCLRDVLLFKQNEIYQTAYGICHFPVGYY